MNNHIFAFKLSTTQKFNVNDSVFADDGNPIGRILSKSPIFKDEYDEFEYEGEYSYDIESTKEIYENLDIEKIKLNIDKYSVNTASTYYTHKESKND